GPIPRVRFPTTARCWGYAGNFPRCRCSAVVLTPQCTLNAPLLLDAHTDPARPSVPRMEVASPVNNVQRFREAQLMAKAELARRAGVSESTIDRIEAGKDCRMETKRKILFALGL